MTGSKLSIRDLKENDELLAVEALQKKVWGFRSRAIVPHHVLYVASHYRGILAGAFWRDKLVGFVLGFLGQRDGKLCHVSHMLGVLPAYRGRGIGEALKWYQRDRAVNQGIDLMTWTFDPLEGGNAHLNLHKLGAFSRTYYDDLYGNLDNRLNRDLPTDRLLVEWDLLAPAAPADVEATPVIMPEEGKPVLYLDTLDGGQPVSIMIPDSIQELKRRDLFTAKLWRVSLREAFTTAFARGYVARDVVNGQYILIPGGMSGGAQP